MLGEWRDIPGFGGRYQASWHGQVRRVYSSGKTRMLTPYHKKMAGSQRLVVHLTHDGKRHEKIVMSLVAQTFIGKCPEGCVPYHKSGDQEDNSVPNIAYISKVELGRMTGAKSNRKPVAKLGADGAVLEFYSSARECARQNFCSYQTVIDRCNGKVKKSMGGIDFAWEDSGSSMRRAAQRLAKRKALMI